MVKYKAKNDNGRREERRDEIEREKNGNWRDGSRKGEMERGIKRNGWS